MKNKLLYVLGVLTVTAVIGVSLYSGQGQFFQGSLSTSVRLTDSTVTTATEPSTLSSSTLSTRYNEALKLANLSATSALPSVDMQVTPVAPRHTSGAKIGSAGPIGKFDSNPNLPNGAYEMIKGTFLGARTLIYLGIPTTQNSLYIMDCQIQPDQGSKVAFIRNGITAYPPIENGHAIYAFQASATTATATVIIEFEVPQGYTHDGLGKFYGCNIDKI